MDNRPIGIFDSGIGGLSIFLAAKKVLPKENFIYLADQKNCPYGDRTKEEVREISFKNSQFLLKKRCKIIVIACNTATVSSIRFLRRLFPKVPFVGVVPVVKPAAEYSKTGHIVILSTAITQKSLVLKQLIEKFTLDKKVYNLACSGLADLIEKGKIKGTSITRLLKHCLKPVLDDLLIDVVATGCTHYFFVKSSIVKLFQKRIKFIEPSQPVARQIGRILKEKKLCSYKRNRDDRFFTTGNSFVFNQVVKKLTGLNIQSEKIEI